MAKSKNTKTKKTDPKTHDVLHRELFGIAALVLAFLFAFSLGSYSPDDPSLDSAATKAPAIHNLLGIVGSHLAGILIHLFGLASFWFPITFFMML